MIDNKIRYIKNGPFDELYTPDEAVECILKYIPSHIKTIWEPTAIESSRIVEVLVKNGYKVITSHINNGQDFLKYEPVEYDMIITNPPYSKKDIFLERAFILNKPFMMLLPITTLEGKKRSELFNKNKIQLLIPNKRFNFIKDKKGSWFQTSWFCYKINMTQDINFIEV